MLKKIIKIKGVGRFQNYGCGSRDVFAKTNLIYAENGKGKTTLTAIFKSLKEQNPTFVTRRRTFNFKGLQEVEILSDCHYSFTNDSWNKIKENLEVFDTYFVNENVYSGLEFSSAHKKGLHKYVLGKEGIRLSQEINLLKTKNDDTNKEIRNLEKVLEAYRGPVVLTKFIALEEDTQIEEKIKAKKKEIKTSEDEKSIQSHGTFETIKEFYNNFDFSEWQNDLTVTMAFLTAQALKKLSEHKETLGFKSQDLAEKWIEDGFEASQKIDNQNCPFCLQDLSGSSIFKIYQEYFNKEYRFYREQWSSCKYVLSDLWPFELPKVEISIAKNQTAMQFWKDYLPSESNLFDPLKSKSRFESAVKKLQDFISVKMGDPTQVLNISILEEFRDSLLEMNKDIQAYNSVVSELNPKIDSLKKTPSASIFKLREELQALEAQKKRFDSKVIDLCGDYQKNTAQVTNIKIKIKELQSQLDTYSKEIFDKYSAKINEYLSFFNTNFKIKRIESLYSGSAKDPYADYVIEMDGHEIKFEDDGETYTVRHTLSDGDKNSLAFSFFLARLDLDNDIQEKVVVFDDPLSSLDTARRRRTVESINNLSKRVKQIIVLSHNDNFVFRLYNADEFRSSRTFQITDNGEIVEWDIENAMKHPYFATIEKIEDYISNSNGLSKREAKQLVRYALEDDLKFRFHNFLKVPTLNAEGNLLPAVNRENGTLGFIIDKLRFSSCRFRADKNQVIQELESLNEFCCGDFHGEAQIAHVEGPDDTSEIQGYLKNVLTLINERL